LYPITNTIFLILESIFLSVMENLFLNIECTNLHSFLSNNLSLKYQSFKPSDCKDIEIRNFQFVEKTLFLWFDYQYLMLKERTLISSRQNWSSKLNASICSSTWPKSRRRPIIFRRIICCSGKTWFSEQILKRNRTSKWS